MNQDVAVFIVPFLLVIGCALEAGGGLYAIDIEFLKNRTQAIASAVGGFLILGILEIVLAGSSVNFFKAQQTQTSACELEGEAAHPEGRLGGDASVIQTHIRTCMKDAGYEWTGEHRQCRDAAVATNSYCYLPAAGFERAVTAFQQRFE